MAIANDPKPSQEQMPERTYESSNLREITDENVNDNNDQNEFPDSRQPTAEDWINMYMGKKMEENY